MYHYVQSARHHVHITKAKSVTSYRYAAVYVLGINFKEFDNGNKEKKLLKLFFQRSIAVFFGGEQFCPNKPYSNKPKYTNDSYKKSGG